MILQNATPRLQNAFEKANATKEPQEVAFIYNELRTNDTIVAVFVWLFNECITFAVRYDEYRFIIIIQPKSPA